MRTEHKEFIVQELKVQVSNSSQKKVAKRAQVSEATVSQMINENWDLIRDELWAKVKVNLNIDWEWVVSTQISNFKLIQDLLDKSQRHHLSICISDNQGLGKTETYKYYQARNKNVILIQCKNYWSKKSFARHQLLACGVDPEGTTEEMIERFHDVLKKLPNALVIYDQFDKLKEVQKDLFMDNYNELPNVGFVLSGVSLKKQERRGINLNKMGYRERYSRYGSKWISLEPISLKDVSLICNANGISDQEEIDHIFDECEGDLRRVKRSIQKYFIQQSEKRIA